MSLIKYNGEWNAFTARHLLNRATFAPSKANVDKFVNQGLEASVLELLLDLPLLPPPVNPEYESDDVPIGETWVYKPEREENITIWWRTTRWWGLKAMIEEQCSVREKMTLFLHNHFVSAVAESAKYRFQYHDLLRRYSLGNVKELTKEITINASMLLFLNGEANTSEAPNENFARELLELFTVGKGDTTGPGDYSTFTESDVLEAAKILTGWSTDYSFDSPELPAPVFNQDLHDNSTKQLSSYFDNTIIENADDEEYKNLIDVIYNSNYVASKIVRDIYIWFVHYDITESVEEEVIAPLAQLFEESNFEIKPVLKELFESAHFYNESLIGGKIKSPFEYVVGFTNLFNILMPETLSGEFRMMYGLTFNIEEMGQAMSRIATVAGWKAYHQNPSFYKNWIDSITLPLRMGFIEKAIRDGHVIIGHNYQLDVLKYVANVENVAIPELLIKNIGDEIYSFPLSEQQIEAYKNILIPGLPDFEWTVEYSEYLSDTSDEQKKIAVQNRLKNLLVAMVLDPSFQLH